MSNLQAIILSTLGSGLLLILTFFAGRFSSTLRYRARTGYLLSWLGDSDEIVLLLPNFFPYCSDNDFIKQLPKNVLMMPNAEGAAVARLVVALHTVKKDLKIRFDSAEQYPSNPHHLPVISIGGPSVNPISGVLLKDHPYMNISYPSHDCSVNGRVFKPAFSADGNITDDYGFMAAGKFKGAPYIVLCGVYSSGTWAAVQTLTNLDDASHRDKIAKRSKLFLVSYTEVDGFELDPETVCVISPQPVAL